MPVLYGSRFEGVGRTVLSEDEEERVYIHNRIPVSDKDVGSDFIVHTLHPGEMLDGLAYRYYGKARLWWVIADVNEILFPLEVEAGAVLKVPTAATLERLGIG